MPYKSKQEGGAHKGSPSQTEKSKAQVKEVDEDELERTEEFRDRYADDEGNPDPKKVKIAHGNRNTDKPDIDKPAYGNSK